MAKISRPVLYTLVLGAVAYAAVVLTEPEQPAPKATTKKPTAPKVSVTGTEYTPEDLKAKFVALNEMPKNAFKPLVVRASAESAANAVPPQPNGIPSKLTGGTGNWVYSGSVEVNGVTSALLEDQKTGEGIYLKRGQKWFNATVTDIGDESIVLAGPDGTTTRVSVAQPDAAPSVSAPVTPVAPPLSGVIGGGNPGIAALPGVNPNDLSVQPNGGNPFGGRRRRRQ